MRLKEVIGKFTPADVILLAALLFVSTAGFVFVKHGMPGGAGVVIEACGKEVYSLSLAEEGRVAVEGTHGTTVVEIKNHKARVIDSPCPDKLCLKQGWIDKGVIVCLPNRVIIRTNDATFSHRRIDAVTK